MQQLQPLQHLQPLQPLQPKNNRPIDHKLLLLALFTLLCTCGRAQIVQPDGPRTALSRAYEKGNLLVALSPVQWRTGLALAATQLRAGGTITVEVSLSKRHDYAFVATTDVSYSDLDLYLRDSLGNILFSDQEADGTPILEFKVPRSGNYRLQLHLAAANEPDNWVGLALLQSAGSPVTETDYRRQADRFFTAVSGLTLPANGQRWTTTPGCWAVQGFLLAAGKGLSLSGIRLGAGNSTFMAVPGQQIDDLSLYLANQRRKIIAQSRTGTTFPLLSLQTAEEQGYDLRIESKGHSVPSLVLLGAFEN